MASSLTTEGPATESGCITYSSGMSILYLFPDTNLFIQCGSLKELSWSQWSEFEEVRLVVCRPVQREIDYRKYQGGRVGKRARKTHSLFSGILVGNEGFELVRQEEPRVKLTVEPEWIPAPGLKDRLDYSKADDEIVGCLYAFRQTCPEADARVLTNDGGVMATSRMVDVPFTPIPDGWLLPPESTSQEKKIKLLEEEVARLQEAEPKFRVKCLDDAGNEPRSLKFEYVRHEPIADDAVRRLMEKLRTHFPPETDFGPREPAIREVKPYQREVYTPASEEEIAAYTDEKYPAWLHKCETILRNYHDSLQRAAKPPEFCFSVVNEGTRPGNASLITFRAKGNFKICPPQEEEQGDDTGEGSATSKCLQLPSPPAPPRGKWRRRAPVLNALDWHRRMVDPLGFHPPLTPVQDFTPRPPDPNKFYFKDRPETPVTSFAISCAQWRHGGDDEEFFGEIFFEVDDDSEVVNGVLECRIEAENLSNPVRVTVPVQITIRRISAKDRAKRLVSELIASANFVRERRADSRSE